VINHYHFTLPVHHFVITKFTKYDRIKETYAGGIIVKPSLKEKQLKRKRVYTCDFLDVYEDDVVLPNNKRSQRVVVSHIGAAAAVPITKDGDVILVRQYRYAAGYDSLEIPAGKKDHPDDEPLETASRELGEETHLKSDTFEHLTSLYTAIGFSDELIHIYLAKDVVPVDYEVDIDPDEFLNIEKIPLKKAIEMAKDGSIKDAKTVVALLLLESRQ